MLLHAALLLIWLHMATLVPCWKDDWMATFRQHMKTGQHVGEHRRTIRLVKVRLAAAITAVPQAYPGREQPVVI